jgi:hypothetical protein
MAEGGMYMLAFDADRLGIDAGSAGLESEFSSPFLIPDLPAWKEIPTCQGLLRFTRLKEIWPFFERLLMASAVLI